MDYPDYPDNPILLQLKSVISILWTSSLGLDMDFILEGFGGGLSEVAARLKAEAERQHYHLVGVLGRTK